MQHQVGEGAFAEDTVAGITQERDKARYCLAELTGISVDLFKLSLSRNTLSAVDPVLSDAFAAESLVKRECTCNLV